MTVKKYIPLLENDTIKSPGFSPGFMGSGWGIDEENHLTVDSLTVRKTMNVFELIVNKIQHVGGAFLLSCAAAVIENIEELDDVYRCYVKDKDRNFFTRFDQAVCQVFERNTTRRYWRLVTGVADDFSYIDLSKTDCESGSAIPAAGDEVVQLGHRSTANRQNAILISSYGSAGAYQQFLKDVNSFSTVGKVKIQLGDETFFEDVSRFSIRSGSGTSYRVPAERGAWAGGTYYYYDRVSHAGNLWLCVAQPSTAMEPADGSPVWEKQVAKGDDGGTGYRIEKIATPGYDTYREGQNYSATLGVMVFYNEEDITGTVNINRFKWERVSENTAGDPTWNGLHANAGAVINITGDDLAGDTSFILQFLDTETNQVLTTKF